MNYRLLPFAALLAACSAEPSTTPPPVAASPAAVTEAPADTVPIDYARAVENLPGSDYYFPVHVYNVAFKTAKKAFEQRADSYSAPTYVDGKRLTFSFEMTNPYDKALTAPIPEYFRLQSACFDLGEGAHVANTSYNRSAHTYEMGGSNVTTDKGQELYRVPGAERYSISYRLPFKPHQTRRFKVVFEHAFAADCPAVTLLGFTKSDQEAGKQIYVGMVLDVATGEVVDQLHRPRNEAFVSLK